jgi:arylsulfatase A-like enzyme
MSKFNRRDFLKISSTISGAFVLSNVTSRLLPHQPAGDSSVPNILIFVFDAMSANNLSLYGYKRNTTPNFERFAQKATVYNSHYSAASFTTPGTASMLTGLYPWTHRAINESGLIARDLVEQNLFRSVGDKYHRLAFSQNMWPNYFFGQFHKDIDDTLSPASFSMIEQVIGNKFGKDLLNTYRAFDDFLFVDGTPPSSLVLGVMDKILLSRAVIQAQNKDYPQGLPRAGNYPIFFQLKDVFAGVKATVEKLNQPSLAYLHFFSPHDPYRPTNDFLHLFADGWAPKPKTDHLLGDHLPLYRVNNNRQAYDRYVANLDFEFGKLIDFLEEKGFMENSYIVVTSDHGEMFERGVISHTSPLLYDPVIRIPLLISAPGQKSRQDVFVPTSNVDLLPTLAYLAGGVIPNWTEGELLPYFGGQESSGRSIFMMDAKTNPAFSPLTVGSFVIRKDRYKLIYYKGYAEYDGNDHFELYDLGKDPDELNDLYSTNPDVAKPLQAELLGKIEAVNLKYKHAQ